MMERRYFTILSNEAVARDTFRLELASDDPAYIFTGEFVDIALEGFYLRRPISVCDWEPGRIVLIYKVVGKGTEALSLLPAGSSLDLLVGLGRGFNAEACSSSALLVGGGLGAAPLLPLCRKLKERGCSVTAVLGFNTAEDMVLEREFSSLCDRVEIATLDGSAGTKGFVTDTKAFHGGGHDFFYTCGPLVMMKAVCQALPGPGELSLEERMGCGAGFCYGCSCKTILGSKRICADGPVFRKEEIIW